MPKPWEIKSLSEARYWAERDRPRLEAADRADAPLFALQRAESDLEEADVLNPDEGDHLAWDEDGQTVIVRGDDF